MVLVRECQVVVQHWSAGVAVQASGVLDGNSTVDC